MCMLCVVRNWSRRLVRVLPWLVIPLVGLWALSHLLAPGLQFEISSPRLACVIVLLGTVFWYEVLLPQLSTYAARRSARVRERQRAQAAELQKLRKVAARRCRNCLSTYREQNPGSGKFICSNCGHASKRPVLDLPGPPGRSGFVSSLIGNNSWFCNLDHSAEGDESVVGPFLGNWIRSSQEPFLTGKSYSGAAVFNRMLLCSFFSCVKWFYQRVLRLSSYGEDSASDMEHKGLPRKDENGCHEGKEEKARRKAEEKRQARLEKEMLEEEERKQREEVARLIEERRKLRDESMEYEKERLKGLASDGERDNRRETEKKRHDRRKGKAKSSSKSNSDGGGREKRGIRETEKKHEYERKGEAEKWHPYNLRIENQKINIEVNNVKSMANKSKHFDHLRGSSLSSSRSINGTTTIFGKGSHNSTSSVTRAGEPIGGFVDRMQRETHAVEHVIEKSLSNGGAKTIGTTYPQHTQASTLKRSWHELFTCPSAGLACTESDANALETLSHIGQPGVHISQSLDQRAPNHPLHTQMQLGQSLVFPAYPLMSTMTGNSTPLVAKSGFSLHGESGHNFPIGEAETFEDPCYVPDPISLIGPVSESLDNFFVDAVSGFTSDSRSDQFHICKDVSDSADANNPSPIESPMPKLWLSEEMHITPGSCSQKSQDQSDSADDESNGINEHGTWHMWSSPLCQDLLDLVGAPASCPSAPRQDAKTHEGIIHPPALNPMASHAVKENNIFQSPFAHSHNVSLGYCQSDGIVSSVTPILAKNDPWLQGTILHPLSGDGDHIAQLDFNGTASQNVKLCESPKGSGASQTFDQLPAHSWSKDWAAHGGENIGSSNITRPHIPANPDVQTIWSFS